MVMGLGYKRPAIVDYLCMTAGTCLMGIAIQSIYDPVGMVVGGFTGVAIRDVAPRVLFRIQGSGGADKSEIVRSGLDGRMKF